MRIEDARLDLVKEGLDISVRPAPADESFVVRKLFDFERIVCAAPAYIRRFGAPRTPAELAQHRCLAMSGTFSSEAWAFQGPEGLVRVKVQPFARVNNADAIFRLGLMGHGLIRINEFIGVEAMREGRLVRVMADYPSADGSQMLALYPHERHRLPRVAAMLDFLQESFGSRPWRKPDARLRSARASSATAARRPPAGSR